MREAAIVLRAAAIDYPALNTGKGGSGWNRAADLLERDAEYIERMVEQGYFRDDCFERQPQPQHALAPNAGEA